LSKALRQRDAVFCSTAIVFGSDDKEKLQSILDALKDQDDSLLSLLDLTFSTVHSLLP
jgi:hypothetical protein